MPTLPSDRVPALGDLSTILNRHCHCIAVDERALAEALETQLPEPGFYRSLRASHPHLFSPTAVFVGSGDVARMRAIITAVETLVTMPAYRTRVLAWSDDVARFDPGPRGAFLGYDFHLGPDGPQLIEINTNAGGALLNTILARATRNCCSDVEAGRPGLGESRRVEDEFVAMLREEWRLQRGDAPLMTIAIVDDDPPTQYLYPEFRLFETLFRRHGLQAVIADAAHLEYRQARLTHGESGIDLVYNRLTDFALAEPRHTALRAAYLDDAVVVTPHPRAYALYAHKRNLTLLGDEAFLRSLALPPETVATLLTGIPRTELVTPENAVTFWSTRREWFFKPVTGFGSRAAYRGDKVTRRVFDSIAKGGYVAQRRADPTERASANAEEASLLKFDVRGYVYAGAIQLLATRLYRGQTTNFRTPGGGFAAVFEIP